MDQIERGAAKVETGRGHVKGRAKRAESGTGPKRDPADKEQRRGVVQDPNHVGRERQNAREAGVFQSRWRSRGGRAGKVAGGESHGNGKSRESGRDTGDKPQCSGLEHCKHTVSKWTIYLPHTHPAHCGYTWNVPSQFLYSFSGAKNAQYIHSFPGHVTKVFQSGNPWEHLEFSQRKYLQCYRVAHSQFTLQFSQWCNHSVPSQKIQN